MLGASGKIRRSAITLAGLLAIAPAVAAQSITDARRVEFRPSAEHDVVDPTTGVALVTNYTLDVFLAGGTTPQATANLAKPTPEADGMIRVDFVALLSTSLIPGVIYETVVNAVGPGGTAPSARSNTFSFTAPCAPTISPASLSLTAAAGTAGTTVSAATGCVWTAVSNAAWIAVTAGAAGTGNGTVTFGVEANTGTSRTGTLTIAGNTLTVTQAAPCAFTISPTSSTLAASGGSGTVTVTTSAGCSWSATSGASWVTIASGATGSGSGSVGYTAASNTATQSRSATLTIAGKSFVVSEAGAPCTFSVSPLTITVPPGGGTGSITVTTVSTCAWTVSSGASWITLSGSRTGSGTATYTVGANTGSTSRTALVTVAGASVGFNQGAATAPLPPANLRVVR